MNKPIDPSPPTRLAPRQAYKGRADLVGCLLDCGAGVNECETRRARTALYLACEFDHADVVALLLRRGADQVRVSWRWAGIGGMRGGQGRCCLVATRG
jgi:uncharacterized Fe-S cluster-containing radical SAM superfamily protein